MASIKVTVERELSELKETLDKILGESSETLKSELDSEIGKKGELKGVWLVRRMFELGADPERVKDMLQTAWNLEQDTVQRVMETARKPEDETDAELRIGAEGDSESTGAEGEDGEGEEEEIDDLDRLLKRDTLKNLDDELE